MVLDSSKYNTQEHSANTDIKGDIRETFSLCITKGGVKVDFGNFT